MRRTPRSLAAALLSLSLVLSTPAGSTAAPLPADQAYQAVVSMRLDGATPFGAVLLAGGRELLVAERQTRQGTLGVVGFSLRDATTGRELRRLRPRASAGLTPQWAVSEDRTRLVFGAVDGDRHAVLLIDVATDQELHRLSLPAGRQGLGAVTLSPDARRVAAVTQAGSSTAVLVWDVQGSAAPREIRVDAAHSIAFSPGGDRVVTASTEATGFFGGSSEGVAAVWDVATGRRLTEVRLKDGAFMLAGFSPDGTRILTANRGPEKSPASVAAAATWWDAGSGQRLLDIGRGEGSSSSLALSDDGARIATSSTDGRVAVWDARTGALLARLAPQGRAVGRGGRVMIEIAPGAVIGLPEGISGVVATFGHKNGSLAISGLDGTLSVWTDIAEQRATDRAAFTANRGQAEAGDAAAMHRLAAAYRDGRGVGQDTALASSWLSRAADAGHAPANVELGNLLVSGSGDRQDCAEGGARLRKASSQGDAAAGSALDAVLGPLGGRQGAAGMSPQIQADLLETQIIDVLKRSEYPAFLANLCALEALGHAERLPSEARRELTYHRAVGLRAAGKPKAALAALTQYLNEAGNAGANYTAAIRLLRPLQEEAR